MTMTILEILVVEGTKKQQTSSEKEDNQHTRAWVGAQFSAYRLN